MVGAQLPALPLLSLLVPPVGVTGGTALAFVRLEGGGPAFVVVPIL